MQESIDCTLWPCVFGYFHFLNSIFHLLVSTRGYLFAIIRNTESCDVISHSLNRKLSSYRNRSAAYAIRVNLVKRGICHCWCCWNTRFHAFWIRLYTRDHCSHFRLHTRPTGEATTALNICHLTLCSLRIPGGFETRTVAC